MLPPIGLSPLGFLRTNQKLIDYITTLLNTNGGAVWPCDDPVGQAYQRVINPAVPQGRNIAANGTMDNAVVSWSLAASVTISGGVANFSASPNGNGITQSVLTIGRVYSITYDLVVVSGTINARAGSTGIGPARSISGTYTDILICAGSTALILAAGTAFTGTIDNVICVELNIPASTAVPVQILTDGDMESALTTSWTASNSTLSKVSGTRLSGAGSRVLQIARSTGTNPDARQTITTVVGQVYRVSGYGRSADGLAVPACSFAGKACFPNATVSQLWQYFDTLVIATSTSSILQLFDVTSTGTQLVQFDDVRIAVDTGIDPALNVMLDGDMEVSGTGYWTSINSAVVTKETSSPHGGSQNLRLTYGGNASPQARSLLSTVVIGKTYLVTFWYRTISTGTSSVRVLNDSGTAFSAAVFPHSSTWAFGSTVGIPVSVNLRWGGITLATGEWVEFDDITVTEISPLVSVPVNGPVLGNVEANDLLFSVLFDGVNDYMQPLGLVQLNGLIDPNEFTIFAFVDPNVTWQNATARTFYRVQMDANNNYFIQHSTTSGQIRNQYTAASTANTVNYTIPDPGGWILVSMRVSKSLNIVSGDLNGVTKGSTTISGTIVGNIISNGTQFGAANTVPGNPHSGSMTVIGYINKALTDFELLTLAGLGDVA